jgi:hypothetical protein
MQTTPNKKRKRGFAAIDPEYQRELASRGGRAAQAKGTGHKFTPEEASAAGQIGGRRVSENREHMAEIGRRGGLAVSKDLDHMRTIGSAGGNAASK